MYFLFHQWCGPDFSREKFPELIDAHKEDFLSPSIESFVAHVLTDQKPAWTLAQLEDLRRDYFRSRHRADVTDVGRLLEAALLLYVAEANRAAGDINHAQELIALAVEAHPSHVGLRAFEAGLSGDLPDEIFWHRVLLPQRKEGASGDGATS